MSSHCLAALLLGAALTAAPRSLASPLPPPPCMVTMTPVQVRWGTTTQYQARVTVRPNCPASRVFRVRKSSTISVKRDGAPWQPIKPDGSAKYGHLFSWSVSRLSSNIPPGELWDLTTWRWEWWDGRTWRPIPGAL